MTPAMLRQLLEASEARKTRDLARLDALNVQVRGCDAEAAEAARVAATDMADAANADLPLAFQGLRMTYADQRIAAAERRRRELEPEVEAARATAAESFGKHQALERMLDEAERERAYLRAARAERDAPPPAAPEPS